MRWQVGLEEGARDTPRALRLGMGGKVGTAAASVLGDLAVVFGVHIPAQADGQEHPQELLRGRARVSRGGLAAQPQRPQGSTPLSRSTHRE